MTVKVISLVKVAGVVAYNALRPSTTVYEPCFEGSVLDTSMS